MHNVDDADSAGSTFYREALGKITNAGIPFLVGGAYALQVHTGIVRRTKDFDIFMMQADVPRTLKLLHDAGYQTELTFPHWIAKAFCGDDFIDVIFNSGNGVGVVDQEWFDFAVEGEVLGMHMKLCPAEETIWQKAFILERDRCDVADVAHLLRHCGAQLDWHRLVRRFADRWRVLLAQVVLFDFIYPGHRAAVPDWIRSELLQRMQAESAGYAVAANGRPTNWECHGTYLSATQYLRDVDIEGYRDARLQPIGNMTREDVAVWTANFMKPK
jgi:hypothetical protein